MRLLTIFDLMRLTRIELWDLAQRIIGELPAFPDGSPERDSALVSLRNIRYVGISRREAPTNLNARRRRRSAPI